MYLKNGDCVLHAVEPVTDKINERPRTSGSLLPSLRRNKTEWFRLYKEFTFPDAHDVIFLKTRIAVLCAKRFNIMDLTESVILSHINCAVVYSSYSYCKLVTRVLLYLNAMMSISRTFQNVAIRVVR